MPYERLDGPGRPGKYPATTSSTTSSTAAAELRTATAELREK